MAKTKREPEEILDEEREQVLERVCAIDVAKDFGQVCADTTLGWPAQQQGVHGGRSHR